MANRRMFSRMILEKDSFYRMPPHAQMLYVHLCMAADDEGFVAEMDKIRRQQRARTDHVEMLVQEGLIYRFPGEIYLILHWRCSNYIRRGRGIMTLYREKRERVYIRPDDSYAVAEEDMEKADLDEWIRAENLRPMPMDMLQDRRQNDGEGKDRTEKDKDRGEKGKGIRTPDRRQVFDFFAKQRLPDVEIFFDLMEAGNWKRFETEEEMKNWKEYARQWGETRKRLHEKNLV